MATATLMWDIVNRWRTGMLVVAMAVAQKLEFLRLWSNTIQPFLMAIRKMDL